MFSVGVLYSAREFLQFIGETPNIDLRFPELFRTFSVASPSAILETSQKCGWVKLNVSGYLELTDRGKQIVQTKDAESALTVQIGHLIESYLPPWIPLLSRGRLEAQKYMPVEVLQCFREAGLFGEASDEVVSWWDRYSKVSRKIDRDTKLEIGRQGERLSLQHERQRTGKEPIWESIDTNLSGFDVLSVVDKDSTEKLRIEVKTSNSRPEQAVFFLTRNEWNVALTSDSYVFHLWSLKPKPHLACIDVTQVNSHVPIDQGDGEWQRVMVKFSAFQA